MSCQDDGALNGRAKEVKRNLFGTVDHQQVREDLRRELQRISEEKSRTWNFDFENFKPLRGRFKWERVGKRLQTRKSPTELQTTSTATGTAFSTEIGCQTITVEPVHVATRYNLRTREKELQQIAEYEFRPVEPAPGRWKRFGDIENSITGHCRRKRRTKAARNRTSTVDASDSRKPNLTKKKSRRSTST